MSLIQRIKMKKIFIFIFSLLFFASLNFGGQAVARENVDYWYIKDFQTTIEILADDSAIITENIIADCGRASDKHGIFRIVPTQSRTPDGTIYTPIELISITDFNGNPYHYQNTVQNGTITWKIGSSQIRVSGENNYRIKYKIRNIIRDQEGFDEFYWNLSGNYWDLEIDRFKATIILIPEINSANTEINLYDGAFNSQGNTFSSYSWTQGNVLEVESQRTMKVGEGITLSLIFPKNYISHQAIDSPDQSQITVIGSVLSNRDNNRMLGLVVSFYFLFFPLLAFLIAYILYRRQQKQNPYHNRVLVAEYSPPEDISPIMLGFMDKQRIIPRLITASIVRMGFLKLLTIKEAEKKVLFAKSKYLEFIKSENQESYEKLYEAEKYIYETIFKKGNQITSNELKNNFNHSALSAIKKIVKTEAKKQDYLAQTTNALKRNYLIVAIIFFLIGAFVAGIILLVFYSLNKNLGKKGEKLYWQIQGFKKYMNIAEKDRHSFYEKENIFTKLLPYSIAIGNVKEWTKKMTDIYGEEYVRNSLYWYVGANIDSSLNSIDSITKSIDSISSNINSSVGSSSGGGGGGFSGGGSGGGGGGGW
jgi:uncharacterized membrane protein